MVVDSVRSLRSDKNLVIFSAGVAKAPRLSIFLNVYAFLISKNIRRNRNMI